MVLTKIKHIYIYRSWIPNDNEKSESRECAFGMSKLLIPFISTSEFFIKLQKLYNMASILSFIRNKRLEWFEHTRRAYGQQIKKSTREKKLNKTQNLTGLM